MEEQNKQEAAQAPAEEGAQKGSFLTDQESAKKLQGYVKEVVDLFRPRVEAGELTQFQVAEILSVALTGSIYGTIPQKFHEQAFKESDSLLNNMWKHYDARVKKKNPMFGAQLLAPARFASYVVSQGSTLVENVKAKMAKAEAEVAAASDKTTE